MKLIPAGFSQKTGRNYDAFYACPNKCQQQKKNGGGAAPRPAQPQQQQPDWDNIALGKVRHGVLTSMIQAGWSFDRAKGEVDAWVELIMAGSRPFKG